MKLSTLRNKYRFIKKTKQISKYRGDRIDDGLVRVEFWFEKRQREPEVVYWDPTPSFPTQPYIYNVGASTSPTATYKSSNTTITANNAVLNTTLCSDGITVKGAPTKQDFNTGYTRELEYNSTVITLKLRGANKGNKKVVKKAISVKTKIKCDTCGKSSKSSASYCSRCSTYLR